MKRLIEVVKENPVAVAIGVAAGVAICYFINGLYAGITNS
jgi:hypothetical protein